MNWTQIHLALNHLPVIGLPLALLLLMVGGWRQSLEVIRLALCGIIVLAVLAIGIKFTGDFAAEQSQPQFVAVKDLVSRHEQAADQVTTSVFVLGLSAALAMWLMRRGRWVRVWTILLVLVLGVATCGLYVRCAHSGGQISHPELRR